MSLIALFFIAWATFLCIGSVDRVQFWTKSRGLGLAMLTTLSVSCAAIVPQSETTTPAPSPEPTESSVPATEDPPVTSTTEATTTTTEATAVVGTSGLVVSSRGILGWWDGAWIETTTPESVPGEPGTEFSLVGLDGVEGSVVGGDPVPGCDPIPGHLTMELTPNPFSDFDAFSPGPVAVSASWNLTPYPVTALATDSEVYSVIVTEFLASRGITDPNPVITQLYRTDLEGDGADEVVIVADNHNGEFFQEDSYSFVLVRKVVDVEVQTAVLHDSFVNPDRVEGEIPFSVTAQVAAFVDLNGDGTTEIVVDSAYYEGAGTEVWDYINDDLGFVSVLSTGCGA